MAHYWNYWDDTSTGTTISPTRYYSAWTTGTASTSSIINTWATATTTSFVERVERYVITGFEGWSDQARAVLTRLVNDETQTGFKITLWARDMEITDPDVMIRDLDWFLFKLRQVATAADYQKIADHVSVVRAELASAIEAQSDATGTGAAEGESAAPQEDAQ